MKLFRIIGKNATIPAMAYEFGAVDNPTPDESSIIGDIPEFDYNLRIALYVPSQSRIEMSPYRWSSIDLMRAHEIMVTRWDKLQSGADINVRQTN